ncbi:1616_t:CDS:2, partial [Dentiscutata erythropus]
MRNCGSCGVSDHVCFDAPNQSSNPNSGIDLLFGMAIVAMIAMIGDAV